MQFFINLIFVFLFLFIQYSSSNNYSLCTSKCPQIIVPFHKPLSIPIGCQDNQTNIYDYALVCIIDYHIDYDSKQIYINFKASNETNISKDQQPSEYLVQFVRLAFNKESNLPTITQREYGCNITNDCGRHFYLNTIQQLIKDGQLKLNKIKINLYNQSLTERRCIDSTKKGNESRVQCNTGLCHAYSIGNEQNCTSDNTPVLFSEIRYHSPNSSINQLESINYKCNRNLCNGNHTMEKIKKLLIDYTNWENRKNQIEEKTSLSSSTNNQNGTVPIEEKTSLSSSTNYQIYSYYLLILSLINYQYLF